MTIMEPFPQGLTTMDNTYSGWFEQECGVIPLGGDHHKNTMDKTTEMCGHFFQGEDHDGPYSGCPTQE
jgi:hypothetical protein